MYKIFSWIIQVDRINKEQGMFILKNAEKEMKFKSFYAKLQTTGKWSKIHVFLNMKNGFT